MKKLTKTLLIGCASLLLAFGFAGCEKDCEHVYDNACDVTCNECGESRAVESHDFTAADCDTPKTCTVCGATDGEALGHNYAAADCDTPKTCTACGTTDGKALGHSPANDDGDCTTEIKCSVCGETTTPAKTEHVANADDNDCTTATTCIHCDYIFVEAMSHNFATGDNWSATTTEHWYRCLNEGCEATDSLGAHTPEADDGDCATPIFCEACEWKVVNENENHTPNADDNDCTTAITCSECETITTEAKESHEGEDDNDCTTALHCSTCNTVIISAKADHEDENLNGVCDYCNFEFDYVYDETSKTYIVFTTEGLYAWLEDEWKGINLILGKDIIMPTEMLFDIDNDGINDSNWEPTRTSNVIDGNGYSITGLVIKSTIKDDISGFVSSLDENGVIKNLRLLDADMQFVGINYGILVGYNNGRIENCGVSGNLYVTGNSVAGIAGTNSGTIIACYNDANITANSGVGGIVGQHTDGNTVIGCYNTGIITASNGSSAGGIIGNFYGGSIISCYNTGAVVSSYGGGLIIGYCDGTYSANYASENVNNGENVSYDRCTIVDGETVTWNNAKEAMNNALETTEINWRYVENTGTDSIIRPLILSVAS